MSFIIESSQFIGVQQIASSALACLPNRTMIHNGAEIDANANSAFIISTPKNQIILTIHSLG
jgi:hypothetical protein